MGSVAIWPARGPVTLLCLAIQLAVGSYSIDRGTMIDDEPAHLINSLLVFYYLAYPLQMRQ